MYKHSDRLCLLSLQANSYPSGESAESNLLLVGYAKACCASVMVALCVVAYFLKAMLTLALSDISLFISEALYLLVPSVLDSLFVHYCQWFVFVVSRRLAGENPDPTVRVMSKANCAVSGLGGRKGATRKGHGVSTNGVTAKLYSLTEELFGYSC